MRKIELTAFFRSEEIICRIISAEQEYQMLHIENHFIKEHLLDGNFGLEKESLRITEDGHFSHSKHPFPNDPNIVRDFSENQTEINTGVHQSPEGALEELLTHTHKIQDALLSLPVKEYLWPFSNPPYIQNELDIPIAQFTGAEASKTEYREYLSKKYGRYRMTFSGIHFNFSFSDELLQKDYELCQTKENFSFQDYKNKLYLTLAKKMSIYGWIMVPIAAASPVLDSSFMERGVFDGDIFTGMASVRCSEMGYWNEFTPVFVYNDIKEYTDRIQAYVDDGALMAPSELYYPIRIKPRGVNSLSSLKENGANHIELRMFDLNPFEESGLDIRDIKFAHLMLVWLASTPDKPVSLNDQVHAVQNFKNAARYDLKTVYMYDENGESYSFVTAAKIIIERMRSFFRSNGFDANDLLDYEYAKFENAKNRYAWRMRTEFGKEYVKTGLKFLKERVGKQRGE